MRQPAPEEVLIEFVQIGSAVKVTAADPATLVEVSIVGPAHLGEEALSQAAVRKLVWAIERERQSRREPAAPRRPPAKRGTLA